MQLCDEADHIRNVLDHVVTNYLFKLIVGEWIGKDAEIVNNIGVTTRIRVNANCAGKFVLATAYVRTRFVGSDMRLVFLQ
jgi:hypothetical protein